jgi:hypothetical protein
MNRGTLIPDSAEVKLMCLRQKAGAVQIELSALALRPNAQAVGVFHPECTVDIGARSQTYPGRASL